MFRLTTLRFALPLLVATTSELDAASFDELVVFGSSDLDTGNFNRSCNGLVWAEYLASDWGLPIPTPSNTGGTNYAWGGARTGYGIDILFGNPTPTVGKQIEDYLASGVPDTSKLIIITGGWNDLVVYGSSPATVVSNMSEHISTLTEAGGKHFLVPNLVPPGNSPYYLSNPAARSQFNQAAATLNELWPPELDSLEVQLEIEIYQDDFFGLIQEIAADPSAFGLEDAVHSADRDPVRASTYLYWDNFHFTTAGHRILANSACEAVAAPSNAADFDYDGDVDSDDLLVWQANFGTLEGAIQNTGDANVDGAVDGNDFLIWQCEFGPGSGSESAAVPEPTTSVMLLMIAATSMFSHLRKTNRLSN